ncbi:N-acetyltransferase [Streptomyces sp. Ru87]|uniref:N-acetyltransferase n=1 Tax=Streptomyces sp. Ru87 TaxID=2044307 RepID=UPI000BFA3D45|nr:N-acetyltransferase [Streptomyces sp. Ru87]PGH52490.1 N-acetyltransferase [Streptomyces sp. Ru87]
MRVVGIADGDPLLEGVYTRVLLPSFTPDELEPLAWFRRGLAAGTLTVTAVTDDAGEPVAAAVGDWSPESRVLLLAYLAVAPGLRAGGLGGLLLREVTGSWQERFHPRLTLAEVKHPLAHGPDDDHGDPAARLRFYGRHGARALDLPYFMPALRPGAHRIYGMLLIVLAAEPGVVRPAASTAENGAAENGRAVVRPEVLRDFLAAYLRGTEGDRPPDRAVRDLWAAADRPGGVALLPVDRPGELPCSQPLQGADPLRRPDSP